MEMTAHLLNFQRGLRDRMLRLKAIAFEHMHEALGSTTVSLVLRRWFEHTTIETH